MGERGGRRHACVERVARACAAADPARRVSPRRPRVPVSGREAYEIAREVPEVAELTAELGRLETREEVRDDGGWQVGFFD